MKKLARNPVIARPLSMIEDFLSHEASAGILLMAVAVLALIVANSPLSPVYFGLLSVPVGIQVGPLEILKPLLLWINDGLMAIFFLLVGLEIKREILEGELSSPSKLALPTIAAAGGMAVPALVFVVFNLGDAYALRGWAIPAATDIAFALGVLSLLGSRVPVSIKVFLTALAILDDLGAIVVIALFYTADLSVLALGLAGAGLVLLFVLNRLGVLSITPYVLIGIVVWVCVLKSGVHATLAGVALAFAIPLRVPRGAGDQETTGGVTDKSPAHRMEHGLHSWVAFGVIPIFGFANAGLAFSGIGWDVLLGPVPVGIALGLFIGKQIGIGAAVWLALKLKIAQMPAGATPIQVYAVAVLCGIGFTMSLFIGTLAYSDPIVVDATKVGVFAGSLASAIVGYGLFRLTPAPKG